MKQCRQCHNSQIAPLGYAATKAKYGENFAIQFVRDYRLSHLSNLEQIVRAWLQQQGLWFEREYWLETADRVYLVDFLLPGSVAIEVNGSWAHSHHADRDARKLAALRSEGFTVIVLTEADVLTGAFVGRLAAVLGSSEKFVTTPIRSVLTTVSCYAGDIPDSLATLNF